MESKKESINQEWVQRILNLTKKKEKPKASPCRQHERTKDRI
jgi:hypothetical protein